MHLNLDNFKINARTFEAKLTQSCFGEIEDLLYVLPSISSPLNYVDSFRDLKCELNFMQYLISSELDLCIFNAVATLFLVVLFT
jgi:hypothetical protein